MSKNNKESLDMETFLSQILEAIPDALVACNDIGKIIYANHHASLLFKYPNGELIGADIEMILPDQSKTNPYPLLEEYYSNPNNRSMGLILKDFWGRRKDGTEFMCDISMNRVETEKGMIKIRAIRDLTERKKVGEQLLENKALIKGILATTDSQMAVLESDGVIVTTNESWDKSMNDKKKLTLDKVAVGENLLEVFTTAAAAGNELAKQVLAGIDSVFKKQIKQFKHIYSYYENYDERWFLLRVTSFVNDETKVLLSHAEITDIIRAQQQIKESEMKYKTIVDMTKEMITTLSPDGTILFANKAFKENMLYTDEEIVDLKLPDLLTEETKVGHRNRIKLLRKGETVDHFSGVMIAKNSELLNIEGTVIPVLKDGKHIGTQGFIRNVNEKKKTEKELKAITTQMQHIFNTLDFSFWGADLVNQKMLYVSPKNKDIYGYPDETFISNVNFWYEVIVDEDKDLFKEVYSQINQGKNASVEYRIKHGDSSIRWIESRMTPTMDEGGKLIRLDGISIDITERKKRK